MHIDPGFGSIIFQFLVASIAMLGAWFFMFSCKILSFFLGRKNKSTLVESYNSIYDSSENEDG